MKKEKEIIPKEEVLYPVEKILNKRKVGKIIQYEVKWKGYKKKLTWEPIENLSEVMELIEDYENSVKPKEDLKKSKRSDSVNSKPKNFLSRKRTSDFSEEREQEKSQLNSSKEFNEEANIIENDSDNEISFKAIPAKFNPSHENSQQGRTAKATKKSSDKKNETIKPLRSYHTRGNTDKLSKEESVDKILNELYIYKFYLQ